MFNDSRESFSLLVLVLLFVVMPESVIPNGVSGVPEDGEMTFRVTAGGSPVGEEQYRFRRSGDTMTVERTVRMDIDFFYVYQVRYRHRSLGTWKSGSLRALESSTDFRGSEYSVRLERANGKLVLREGRERGRVIPRDTGVVPTTWWNPDLKRADRLIDSQYGRLLEVSVEGRGTTPVPGIAGLDRAEQYDVSGDLELSVWYGPDDQLVKLRYRRGGYTFVHRRTDY